MKKSIIFSSFIIFSTLLLASPALAVPGKGAVKGEVTGFDSETLTIETQNGETVVVAVPESDDLSVVEVGDWVLVKGSTDGDGVIEADWFKLIAKGRGKGKSDGDQPEGKKENSAFCAEGKQVRNHPLAARIGEHFDVSEEFVMGYFCDGYSMGAIMLALKTRDLDGSDPGEVLKNRADGFGWGQIWQEKGLIGSEREGDSPYGQLKKLEKTGKKDQGEGD
jgi:hypothetical protein